MTRTTQNPLHGLKVQRRKYKSERIDYHLRFDFPIKVHHGDRPKLDLSIKNRHS